MSKALRGWFVAHCIIDVAFALPRFIAPELTLRAFGWQNIDPIATWFGLNAAATQRGESSAASSAGNAGSVCTCRDASET